MNIEISVQGRVARVNDTPVLVCGNATDTVTFTFDSEWSGYTGKTARFVYERLGAVAFQDVPFSGNTAKIPVLSNITEVRIGVFAEDIVTTTPAVVPCRKSIKCGTGEVEEPTPDVYAEIMKLFNQTYIDPSLTKVDTTYDPESYNPQSGLAVAEAVAEGVTTAKEEMQESVDEQLKSAEWMTDAKIKNATRGYFHLEDFVVGSIDRTTGEILSTPKTHLISKKLSAFTNYTLRLYDDVLCDMAFYDENGTLLQYSEGAVTGDGEEHTYSPQAPVRYAFTISGATDIDNETDIQHIDQKVYFSTDVAGVFKLTHNSTDTEVKEGSENLVLSGAVYQALQEAVTNFTDNDLFNKLLARLGLTLEDLKESLPKVYITGDITGISAENYVDVMCQYVNAYNQTEFTDYATIAWQGSSSLNFPVKNYKIKLFTDEEREEKSKRTFRDWHATNNYHLKANFGDCTNFMNNMMMHYLTKSYQYLEPLPRENARYTVDGFPILLYVNNEFSGIYFWNLKQDDKVYNLNEEIKDETTGEIIQEADLCYQAGRADRYNNAGNNSCAFVYGALDANGLSFADAHAEIDHYWEDRVWDKVDNHPDVLYDTIQWVSEATDEEFKANLSKYFNVDYLINYFVCIYTCGMIDSKAKNFNMLYFPEKGVWYPTFWDMDKAFGSGFNTGTVPYTIEFTPKTDAVYEFDAPASRLFDKLIANFWEECCAKYEELRQTLFTVAQVEDSVNAVWGLATAEMVAENKAVKYDGTSYTGFKTDGASFVVDWAEQRFAFMDSIFSSVYAKGYIDASGNIVEADSAYYTVDYTAVTPETAITVKAEQQFNSWRVVLYDENKNFVRRVVATNATTKVYETDTITLNSNEKYLRFSAGGCDDISKLVSSFEVVTHNE